jgi:hypothetical protein
LEVQNNNGHFFKEFSRLSRRFNRVEIGREIVRRGQKLGNCEQMCAVTAYFVDSFDDSTYIFYCDINLPGDHTFLCVGLPPRPRWINIESMSNDISNVMIIDCWANIACPARDFPLRMRNKLLQWDWQNKQIWYAPGDVWQYPGGTYATNMLTSGLSFSDARERC